MSRPITRIIITTAAAALSMSLAAPAHAYGTAPDSSVTTTQDDSETCELGPVGLLAEILGLPSATTGSC